MLMKVEQIELHLSNDPQLPKRYGKRIKAMGGRYSSCRSCFENRRFVILPFSDQGVKLANELWRRYFAPRSGKGPCGTMIARGVGFCTLPAWVNVHYIHRDAKDPVAEFEGKFKNAVKYDATSPTSPHTLLCLVHWSV